MSYVVPRACTVIREKVAGRRRSEPSQLLSKFRDKPAYVLLGDPGMGKTTTFEEECTELGEEAIMVSARDFLSLDIANRPEWQGKTLFIDGLDEVRAGSSDARTPMNHLYGRLDSLRPPRFRISCREADWLGENDRGRLTSVSSNSEVLMLRLDPLTSADIRSLLETNARVSDAEVFVKEAQQRGLDSLLSNPQTLNMLAEVVGSGATWPEGRFDTFDLACRQMALEHNEEHFIGEPPPSVEALLDAAGRLCAVQLIAGFSGYTTRQHPANGDHHAVDVCNYGSNSILKATMSTRLFVADGEGRFAPVHRHIAEFLAARHLAKLIEDGLPARRVIALIAHDGSVVTELRGLSAWLATHSTEARRELIEGDPIGVGLYGDIGGFSSEDKHRLLRSLNREAAGIGYAQESLVAFRPLVTDEMESTLHDLLTDDRRDYDHQLVVEFLLQVMGNGKPLPRLRGVLLEIVRDDSRWPRVTESALDASIQWSKHSQFDEEEHRRLLEDIHAGRFPDPDSELRGMLLAHLYPHEVLPSSIWDFLSDRVRPGLIGLHDMFWNEFLLDQTSDEAIAVLLDELHERLPRLAGTIRGNHLEGATVKILARGLRTHGDRVTPQRLYNWLRACSFEDTASYTSADDPLLEVREWLEGRPDTQKAVFVEGLVRLPDTHDFIYRASSVPDCLFGSNLPDDFGLWCLELAVDLEEMHPRASEYLLRLAVDSHLKRANDRGLSQLVLEGRTLGHPKLASELATLLKPPVNRPSEDRRRVIVKYEEEDSRRRQKWIEHVRSNVEALRENRASPVLLFEIARAYFGGQTVYVRDGSPVQRINELVANQAKLVEAALAGLQGTMWRKDLPSADEVTRLNAESRTPYLALAALAGMNEIERQEPSHLDRLKEDQMRTALTFYYCSPTVWSEDAEWYRRWLEESPELVEDVLVRCATSAIRAGKDYVPGLSHLLKGANDHDRVARGASLRLLRAFPVRCNASQLGALDNLLWIAVRRADIASFDNMIERKVFLKSMTVAQRVCWLAAGAVVSPDKYGQLLEEYTAGRDSRIRELAAFFSPPHAMPNPTLELCADSLKRFIGLIGGSFGPVTPDGWITPAIKASEITDRMIRWLEALPGENSLASLESLRSNDALEPWHIQLDGAIGRRRIVDRDAAFLRPTVERVCQTLAGGAPSNAGDLAALLVDKLEEISLRVRTGNTNDWRQYWNEGPHRRPVEPKHEDSCRDALLSDLREILPGEVDAQPEGRYASDRRSDIRVAYRGFNVPVEAKKNSHRDLWSAIRNQLIEKYTSDPATSEYGIYLVFWFGEELTQPPPHGSRPRTAGELQQRLEDTLSAEEARKISVCVIDVCLSAATSLPLAAQPVV